MADPEYMCGACGCSVYFVLMGSLALCDGCAEDVYEALIDRFYLDVQDAGPVEPPSKTIDGPSSEDEPTKP